MARVLSRDESLRRRSDNKTGRPYPITPLIQAVTEPDAATHPWFDNPVDADERARILDAGIEIAAPWFGSSTGYPHYGPRKARHALTALLDWFDELPGDTYQQRWLAADPDARPGNWCPMLSAGTSKRNDARLGINALIMLGVIRPSFEWLFANKQSRFWRDWTLFHDPAIWDRYLAAAEAAGADDRRSWSGAQHLIRISIVNGIPAAAIHGGHVIAYREFLQSTSRPGGGLFAAWQFARTAGMLQGEPDDLGSLVRLGQRTPAQIVDRYQVASPRVRDLLVDYIAELSTTRDYGSLETCATELVGLFWKQIETTNPGIDTIELTADQATAWKQWLMTRPDGTERLNADSVLSAVRSFYLDLAAWAHEDPGHWAEWAVPCPISVRDVRGSGKRRRARTHRMQARTRSLAPHLPALVAHARRRHEDALALQELVRTTPVGEPFTFNGDRYIRHPTRRGATSTSYVTREGQTTRIDTNSRVVSTCLTWCAIEIFRHTGVRIEELLELTHLSIRQYRKPDGSILPLLQIAPSKTDEERVVPCSPELTAALARLVSFVSIDGVVPLCIRRDPHERTHSAYLPHLFQFREAGRSRVVSFGTIRNWLIDLANDLDLHDVDGQSIVVLPHDFRRMFITDIVNSGFPIHLAAKLVGHKSLDITSSYTAVYQRDVFEAYEGFITRRRQTRPSQEYREPTQTEWAEFVEHFGQRKIALGNCHRPYGASCVHEHACIRCDFLQVDSAQAGRLTEITENLHAQVAEAERHQWLGDVEQLRLTIRHADRKARELTARTLTAPELVIAAVSAD